MSVHTHYVAQKRRDKDLTLAITGTVRVHSIARHDLRCQVRIMTMDDLAKIGPTEKGPVHGLFEPRF